jgi:hypothetical protein
MTYDIRLGTIKLAEGPGAFGFAAVGETDLNTPKNQTRGYVDILVTLITKQA